MEKNKSIAKNKFILIGLLIIILILIYKSTQINLPLSAPNLIVKVNGKKFEATKNEYNWSSFKNSNSNLGYRVVEVAKKIKPYKVPGEVHLKLMLSSDKNIKNFNIRQVLRTDKENYVLKDIDLTNDSIRVPKEAGEYTYFIYAGWDEDHFVEYIVKVVVEE